MKKQNTLLIFLVLALVSCTKDRIYDPKANNPGTNPNPPKNDTIVNRHFLYINEFVASGSQTPNEYGSNEDWFEIYNPQSYAVTLTEGEWYVSDAGLASPNKFKLPRTEVIPSKGFLLIWCDNLDKADRDIHTNFALSGSGEHLVIYYHPEGKDSVIVDDYEYAQQQSAVSEGRYPDGGENWVKFNTPTPGASNN